MRLTELEPLPHRLRRARPWGKRLVLPLAACLLCCAAQGAAPDPKTLIPEFEKVLKDNIVAFWYPKCLDRENGGYIINFGPLGESRGPGTKMIVTQARMVWLFSALARAGYRSPGLGNKELLEAADIGYRFLRERMWDARNGGFYWEVDAAGTRKIRADKVTYGESFALYALSEYYLASKRPEVLQFARQLFDLLEQKAHDKTYGGYLESFNEDWTEQTTATPLGPVELKLMNTHLHMLEAMTTFYRASKLPLAKERLVELIAIESNSVVRKNIGACTDKYTRDWQPRLDENYGRASYGHDVENIWLLTDALDAAGLPRAPYLDLFKTLFAYSLKYGYDSEQGGFFDNGPLGQAADQRDKVWWVQAEALVSSLYMYRMTGDQVYAEVFAKTWDFVKTRQVDWTHGEWFEKVSPAGLGSGKKASTWKAGYHNGRAMLECMRLLR
jgi:mannobiose 2-epimerase